MYRDNYISNVLQDARRELQQKLMKEQEAGVELFVDGKKAAPDEVARKCVQEDLVYMPDYILDDYGRLKQLRFDKVE